MVRSRIGSHVAHENAAETDALSGVSRRAPSLALEPWLEVVAPVRACPPGIGRGTSPFSFIFEIVAPWIGRTARTVALGAMVALGGCGPRVEIDGVVRDGRTGEPIAGAHITTDDGRTLETDADGRFSMSAARGERVVASASDRCACAARVESRGRPLTLRLFDRLDVDREVTSELDAEVRIEVRARCDDGAPIEWRQIGGPTLGADRLRVEDGGRVLLVRTHPIEELVRIDRQGERALGDYRFEARLPDTHREVRVRRGATRARRSERAHDRTRGRAHTLHAASARSRLDGERGVLWDAQCRGCHAAPLDAAPVDTAPLDAAPLDAARADAGARVASDPWASACASCHDGPAHDSRAASEWALSAMSRSSIDRAGDDPALRSECARCHDGRGLAAWQHGGSSSLESDRATALECTTCHSRGAQSPHGLRVFDRVDAVGGAPAEHLGSGAICAACHGSSAQTAREVASHAPQAGVLLGRGARTLAPIEGGAHRFIADTCVRCHMTRPDEDDALRGLAGGHTFSVHAAHGDAVTNAAACAPCHGSGVAPDAIGVRDWDGDGLAGGVADEHERAMNRASDRLRARVAARSITDRCGHVAADVVERDARLVLVDARGVMLGDCDEDGAIAPGEASITSRALPEALQDAAHDLAMLRSDGSAGVHNPAYVFRVIAAATHIIN